MKTKLTKATVLASVAVIAAACSEVEFPDNITNGQGEIAGEATMTSVVLQSRLTVGTELVEGDLPGVEGTARCLAGLHCAGPCCHVRSPRSG